MTQGHKLDHSISQRLLKHFFGNVLLEHVGLIRILPLAIAKQNIKTWATSFAFVGCSGTAGYMVAHKIIGTAQSQIPLSLFYLTFGLDLGLGT